jgi:DNA-binding NarL/FixJ family response regulator
MGRTGILLADDPTIGCAGLAKLLEPQYEITGIVEDGRGLLKAVGDVKPALVLLGIGMPLLNGLDATRKLKKWMPQVKLIFLTTRSDCYIADEALRAGAAGYLLKTSPAAELLQAVRDAMRGVSYVSSQIGRAMEDRFIRDPRALDRPSQLTSRQREVLQMLAEVAP